VIVSKEGYILTNYHVVHGADELQVKTSDGRTFDATIRGVDSLSDVADHQGIRVFYIALSLMRDVRKGIDAHDGGSRSGRRMF